MNPQQLVAASTHGYPAAGVKVQVHGVTVVAGLHGGSGVVERHRFGSARDVPGQVHRRLLNTLRSTGW